MKKPSKKLRMIIIICVCIAVVSTAIALPCALLIETGFSASALEKTSAVPCRVKYFAAGEQGDYQALGVVDGNGNLTNDDVSVLMFTDLHIGTEQRLATKTVELVIEAVQREKPDLVIMTGDIIVSRSSRKRAVMFAEVMEKLQVYWCPVAGNHDGEASIGPNKAEVMSLFASYPHCLAELGSDEVRGSGNYVLNLVKSGGVAYQTLVFMDSGREAKDNAEFENFSTKDGYDYLATSQIEWYNSVLANVNEGLSQPVKSQLFMHIPLCEFKTAFDEILVWGTTEGNTTPFGTKYVSGSRNENECNGAINSGMFEAILDGGSTQAVYAGHDHTNNYIVEYKGVTFAYVQKSGFGSYGDVRGYTRLTVKSDGDFALQHVVVE